MRTPVKIAFLTVVITQALAVLFAWPLGLGPAGLTLATSVAHASTQSCCSGCAQARVLCAARRLGVVCRKVLIALACWAGCSPGWPVNPRSG